MNNEFPSKETVTRVRAAYPPVTRVELVEMDDPFTKLKPGDQGAVRFVDDAGGIHIRWDNGEGLAAVWGNDTIRRL